MSREVTKLESRSKVFSYLSVSTLAVLFVIAISQLSFDGLKGLLVDALYRTQWWTRAHPDMVLVAYDDASSLRYEGSTRLPANEIEKLFSQLAKSSPKAVVLLGTFTERAYSPDDLQTLGRAFAKVPNLFVGYLDDDSLGKDAHPLLGSGFPYLPGFVSRDTFSYGADSVSRRVMLSIEGIPSIYYRVACGSLSPASEDCSLREGKQERVGDSIHSYTNWQGRPGTYPLVPSQSVAEGELPLSAFDGKIVLVSTALNSKRGADHVFTPYSRDPFHTPALEASAHALATLLRGEGIQKSSPVASTLLSLVVALVTVNMVLFLSPGTGILFVMAEVVALGVLSWVGLFGLDYWLTIAHPLVVAGVGYYLVIPYRLVDEYRKRWHYQEKSELMSQLEQLKSNFLSLVSHDLKTPLARIQGNAEISLAESNPLSERQRKSLETIVATTEDLSQYVETVLDLTRIESARMPLQKVSKDVNAVILEALEGKRFLAAEKNIELTSELEPLFSIKFDPKLIRRVVSNLLENAIKYSPPGSTIRLASREEGPWVRIEIKDEGFGIAPEEQPKVFQKFYRVASEDTKDIKGSGLGLYLVKYFVELHKGFVELRSELGKGSTFTISLPV